jgi:hypothetical protein
MKNQILIKIKNDSESIEDVVLFGSNRFSAKNNFGNNEHITITELNVRDDYGALLNELSYKNFDIENIRFFLQSNICDGKIIKHKYKNFGSEENKSNFNLLLKILMNFITFILL